MSLDHNQRPPSPPSRDPDEKIVMLCIDYREHVPGSYEGITVAVGEEWLPVRTGKGIEADHDAALELARQRGATDIYYSSSFDNYIMDVKDDADLVRELTGMEQR